MNGNFYQNPTFPNNSMPISIDNNQQNIPNNIPLAINDINQNDINIIFKLNKGKRVNVYVTFKNSQEEQSKIFTGILENANTDYLIISNPETGKWYLIKYMYLDYIEFMEKINYS